MIKERSETNTMESETVCETVIRILRKKIPERGKLICFLSNLLHIEKEAVYRRLRYSVPFTFQEISTIVKEMNISLDHHLEIASTKKTFQISLFDYKSPSDIDYAILSDFVELLKAGADDPNSEYGYVSNVLPLSLTIAYPYILRFYLLKWMYQFGDPEVALPFSHVYPTPQLTTIVNSFLEVTALFGYFYYIWDELTLVYLLNDISYFSRIRLIAPQEIELIKSDILQMLDDLEKTAISGMSPKGKRHHLYISNLNFESNYTRIITGENKFIQIRSFAVNNVILRDEQYFEKMSQWFFSLKKSSILISGSGEMQRIHFFDHQRNRVVNFVP
ncbi:MAG: hypothetical protein LBD45_09740 [Bacteroidales bacterium]|jgi:hypothetical protein|nr:hypothetical protein [Bacteroidales bacterium]